MHKSVATSEGSPHNAKHSLPYQEVSNTAALLTRQSLSCAQKGYAISHVPAVQKYHRISAIWCLAGQNVQKSVHAAFFFHLRHRECDGQLQVHSMQVHSRSSAIYSSLLMLVCPLRVR